LSAIEEVEYQFPKGFSPKVEFGDPQKAFGDYGETFAPFIVNVRIRFKSGKQKFVKHSVKLPETVISQF